MPSSTIKQQFTISKGIQATQYCSTIVLSKSLSWMSIKSGSEAESLKQSGDGKPHETSNAATLSTILPSKKDIPEVANSVLVNNSPETANGIPLVIEGNSNGPSGSHSSTVAAREAKKHSPKSLVEGFESDNYNSEASDYISSDSDVPSAVPNKPLKSSSATSKPKKVKKVKSKPAKKGKKCPFYDKDCSSEEDDGMPIAPMWPRGTHWECRPGACRIRAAYVPCYDSD